MKKLKVLDLFSGIGGFTKGFEDTGFYETVAFCEIEPFCQKVLKKHWPDVPIYQDITKLCRRAYDCEPENEEGQVVCPRCRIEFGECGCIGTDEFTDKHGEIDVICGGFPCVDLSLIGKQAGIEAPRSGLWKEMFRIIGELRPKYVVVENVAAILKRSIGVVLGDLSRIGYDAEWNIIPATAVNSPHQRKRCWIVAYPNSEGLEGYAGNEQNRTEWTEEDRSIGKESLSRRKHAEGWWASDAGILRVSHGIPNRTHRIKALGNSIVPQIAEFLGREIYSDFLGAVKP